MLQSDPSGNLAVDGSFYFRYRVYKYMKLIKPDINCAIAFLLLMTFFFGCNGIMAQSSSSEIDNASKKLKIHPVVTNQAEVSIRQKDATEAPGTKGSAEKFFPLYTAEGVLYIESLMAGKASQSDALFSVSVDAYCLKNRAIKSLHFWRSAFIMRRLFGHGWLRVQEIRVNQLSLRGYFEP